MTSLVLARDGRALFSTAKDTTFKISATLDGSLRRNLSCNLALSCCDVSPDEKYVFIGSWDNCLYMYSVDVGRVIDQVTAHDDGLSAVCVFDDRVLTSSWDGSIKMWHYTSSGITSAPLSTFMECEESVLELSVSIDGSVGAAGTRNGGFVCAVIARGVACGELTSLLVGVCSHAALSWCKAWCISSTCERTS